MSTVSDNPPLVSLDYADARQSRRGIFTPSEMKRVGIAATMITVTTYVIIVAILAATGHYSSLSHCLPKAVLDGTVIALLLGRNGRWRCLGLLGAVYGLVLLIQPGVPYLFVVMAVAGLVAAVVGRVVSVGHRALAVVAAAMTYEVLASMGSPIRIGFATGTSEPLPWLLWFAEWPLRIVGAAVGVWIGVRAQHRISLSRQIDRDDQPSHADPVSADSVQRERRSVRRKGVGRAGVRVLASVLACIAPMRVQDVWILGAIAGAYVVYALVAGLGLRRTLTALLGIIWGWAVFAAMSYLWHRDLDRVIDLGRTFALRFAPLALASAVLVTTVRPVDVIRLLRRVWMPGFIILPFAHVLRELPGSRRQFKTALARLKREGVWRGPLSVFTHPRALAVGLIGPQFRRWAAQLAE